MKKTLLLFVIGLTACTGMAALSQPPDSAEIAAARTVGAPIAFSAVMGQRNHVGGIDINATWKNISGKPIKYCYLEVYLKNAVGDKVVDNISGRTSAILEFTGPYQDGQVQWGGMSGHPAAIYHKNAKTVHIENVWVVYMDGTKTEPVRIDGMISTYGEIETKSY